jgi:hypothetical protein
MRGDDGERERGGLFRFVCCFFRRCGGMSCILFGCVEWWWCMREETTEGEDDNFGLFVLFIISFGIYTYIRERERERKVPAS